MSTCYEDILWDTHASKLDLHLHNAKVMLTTFQEFDTLHAACPKVEEATSKIQSNVDHLLLKYCYYPLVN